MTVVRWLAILGATTLHAIPAWSGRNDVTSETIRLLSTAQGAEDSIVSSIDTGAFAVGNKDFTRFTVPGMCAAAAEQAGMVSRRTLDAQLRLWSIRRDTPALDTLPAAARAIARSCAARFTLQHTAPTDLRDFFRLSLLASNDTLARTIIRHQLTIASTATERESILSTATQGYLAAEPARVHEAEWMVALADSIAEQGSADSRFAHLQLLTFAGQVFDRDRIRREADRIIALRPAMPSASSSNVPTAAAYSALLRLAFVVYPDSLPVIAQRAMLDLRNGQSGGMRTHAWDSVRTTLDALMPPELHYGGSTQKDIPLVTAAYWAPEKPSSWPVQGRVTLVMAGYECIRQELVEPTFGDGAVCTGLYTHVPDWLRRYGDAVNVVILDQTHAHALSNGPLTPVQEVDSAVWYYRTYRKLPVTIAMTQSVVHSLVTPSDGRLGYTDTTAFGMWRLREYPNGPVAILYASDGSVLYAGELQYPILNALIDREVHAVPHHD